MFLDQSGDTLYYIRRVDGMETLFAWQPDHPRGEHHAVLAASNSRLMAWPCGPCALVCDGWPRVSAQCLEFRFVNMERVHEILTRQPKLFHEMLTDVFTLGGFTPEEKALPPRVFDLLRGNSALIPGFACVNEAMFPALYVIDGKAATYRVHVLDFLAPTTIPAALYTQPDGKRHWLTVSDSSHLFVLDERLQVVQDLFWPAEDQGLARVAFNSRTHEAWVSAQNGIFIYDSALKLTGELAPSAELRWHRGERVRGFLGAVTFNGSQTRAFAARPLAGDVVEYDAANRRPVATWAMTIDPLELTCAPSKGRLYVQGLRSGAISWLPCQ